MTEKAQPKKSPAEKIVEAVLIWRAIDKAAIADKSRRLAEYRARQELRKIVDEAGEA